MSYKTGEVLAYADYGDRSGYPILIQHGMIASISDRHLFDRLARAGARLIAIARPGYGDSSPYVMRDIGEWGEIVVRLMRELGLAQFDVLGISSGAPYGYAIAAAMPEHVRNLFILSGTPALFDGEVQARWPYPLTPDATIAEMQALAYELFFASLPPDALAHPDIRDSMANNCFGIAQDLKLRCVDWGFRLGNVKGQVILRHSKADESVPFETAELTAAMLPGCRLEVREADPHFSQEVLDRFIEETIAPHYRVR